MWVGVVIFINWLSICTFREDMIGWHGNNVNKYMNESEFQFCPWLSSAFLAFPNIQYIGNIIPLFSCIWVEKQEIKSFEFKHISMFNLIISYL